MKRKDIYLYSMIDKITTIHRQTNQIQNQNMTTKTMQGILEKRDLEDLIRIFDEVYHS